MTKITKEGASLDYTKEDGKKTNQHFKQQDTGAGGRGHRMNRQEREGKRLRMRNCPLTGLQGNARQTAPVPSRLQSQVNCTPDQDGTHSLVLA